MARKSGLTDGQLVLIGKGLFAKVNVLGKAPYTVSPGQPVDDAQSKLNKKLGYW